MTGPNTRAVTDLATSDMCVVTAGDIAAYREVVRSGATPAPTGDPSPLYPFVLSTGAFDEIIGRVGGGGAPAVVHLSQDIRVGRLVRPGERVAIVLDVLAARREAKGVRLALRCVLVGGDGSAVSELVTGVLLVGASEPGSFGEMPAPPRFGGGPAGERTVVTREIATDTVRRYADASGDHNPIHLDPEAARAAGFPGVVVHGMCVLALVCEEVVDRHAGGDPARIRGIGGRFSAPVQPEEPLDITFAPSGDGRAVAFSCATPRGPAIKAGWVEVEVAGLTAVGGPRRDGHD